MLILYSGWFGSNLVHPGGELSNTAGETFFTSERLLIFAAWAILIIAVILGVFIAFPGRLGASSRGFAFVSPGIAGLALLLGALHLKICLLERVAVSGDSMQPGLTSGTTLWVEKLSTGVLMPRLSFPFGPILKTGKVPAYGFGLPERFAVIVIDYPGSGRKYLIKRLIGLPGDRYHFQGGRVYINGRLLREKYLAPGTVTRVRPENYQPPIHGFPPRLSLLDPMVRYSAMNGLSRKGTVPPHTVLVLGDNRAHSRDSRSLGFIPVFFISGRVIGR